jgi:hypothetical protein
VEVGLHVALDPATRGGAPGLAERAHNAQAHRALEVERVADRHYELAHLDPAALRKAQARQPGAIQPGFVAAGALGPPAGGLLFDLFGDYRVFFTISMVATLIGAAIFLIDRPPTRPFREPVPAPGTRTDAANQSLRRVNP